MLQNVTGSLERIRYCAGPDLVSMFSNPVQRQIILWDLASLAKGLKTIVTNSAKYSRIVSNDVHMHSSASNYWTHLVIKQREI